jgi:hypothetical protein
MYLYDNTSLNSLRMRNVSDKSYKEIQKTHFVFKPFSENPAVYEIMWKNMVEQTCNR